MATWQDFAVIDLARSGLALTDVAAEDAHGEFSPIDGYKIPYYDMKGQRRPDMFRIRLRIGGRKYIQPSGADMHGGDPCPPYFIPHCDYTLRGKRKIICEGEKKAAAAYKFLTAVQTAAIGGCWNWQEPLTPEEKQHAEKNPHHPKMARLHHELVEFCKGGSTVYYVPDADWRTNENVQRALGSLVLACKEERIDLRIVMLPDGGKGLDDFLMAQLPESRDAAFWALETTDGSEMLCRQRDLQAKLGLPLNDKGRPTQLESTLVAALVKWEWLRNNYYYDTRAAVHMIRANALVPFAPIGDMEIERLKRTLQATLGFGAISRAMMDSIIWGLAYHLQRNPLADHLRSLQWDGTPRFDAIIDKLAVAPDKRAYAKTIMCNAVVAACARALTPGIKFDHCVILEGHQGFGKSTFWKELATLDGECYYAVASISGNSHMVGTRDFLTAGSRSIFYDLDELSVLSKSDVNAVKAMLSTTVDTYRPPYGRSDITVKRSFLCVGSTNSDAYLIDATGNRRFWPVKVGEGTKHFDLPWLVANREQIWAEAMHLLRAGHAYFELPEEFEDMAQAEQDERMMDDGFADKVLNVMDRALAPDPQVRPPVIGYHGEDCYFISNSRLYDWLEIPLERRMAMSRRVVPILKRDAPQWVRITTRESGVLRRGFVRLVKEADAQPRVDSAQPKF